jgi:hypothetical protein
VKKVLEYAIGPLIGLTGISLALYFHFESMQERAPTYYVSPERIRIVDRGTAPTDLQVLYRGKPVNTTSVVAIIVYIWNDGRLPIRSNDILEPLTITLPAKSEILEVRILKESRNVVKFTKGPVVEGAKNSLPIAFDILEQFDGAAIQLTYAGELSSPVSLTGTIVGAGTPKLLPSRSALGAKPQSYRELRRLAYVMLALGALTMLLPLIASFVRRERRFESAAHGEATLIPSKNYFIRILIRKRGRGRDGSRPHIHRLRCLSALQGVTTLFTGSPAGHLATTAVKRKTTALSTFHHAAQPRIMFEYVRNEVAQISTKLVFRNTRQCS